MKNLVLIRHAKSSWKEIGMSDFARTLNQRGQRDIPLMSARLVQRNLAADAIISSPALRALTTATLIAQNTELNADKIQTEASIYESSVQNLFYLTQQLSDSYAQVFLVGHNPGMGGYAHILAPSIQHFPTCALAHFQFNVQRWQDIRIEDANLKYFDYPKK